MGLIVLFLFGFGIYSLYMWFIRGISNDLANIIEAIIDESKRR